MTPYGQLYTIGYAVLEGIEQLQDFLAQRVFLVDIRYVPASRWRPEWSRKRLIEQFAPYYCHIRELGNVNYHSLNLPIQLLDAKRGLARLLPLIQEHDICLLCACADWHTCHRRIVAELVQQELGIIQPVHLSRKDIASFAQQTPAIQSP